MTAKSGSARYDETIPSEMLLKNASYDQTISSEKMMSPIQMIKNDVYTLFDVASTSDALITNKANMNDEHSNEFRRNANIISSLRTGNFANSSTPILQNTVTLVANTVSSWPLNSTSTLSTLPTEEFCSNSHIVSADTIISFTEDTDAILFVCTLLSSVLQTYVMVQAVRHVRQKTGDKCLHVFLFSMTFADFILTALCYPVELAPRAGLIHNFPKYANATVHMLCWIALIVSSLSLVFLNLDKLFYFRFPLRYSKYFTQRRSITLVSGFWLVSSLFVVFAWWTNSFHCVDDDCVTLAIFPNRLHIYVPFMIFVGVIPTLTSLIVAIYIMRIVAAHHRQMLQERSLCPPTPSSRSNSVFVSRMRTFYFIFMNTVFTALTLLPYRISGLHRALNPGQMHDCMTIMLFWIMMYMIYLHSIINPLITITVLPPYRINILSFLSLFGPSDIRAVKKKRHLGEFYKSPIIGEASAMSNALAAVLSDAELAPRMRYRLPTEL